MREGGCIYKKNYVGIAKEKVRRHRRRSDGERGEIREGAGREREETKEGREREKNRGDSGDLP